ncbi:MAG TPA: Na+/H+ antiporter NhaC family protein, partial [Gemmatimonadaceae bacterium]|nr:Na+/H+ antiporter NhaC family protein [Gemmatimonadaceae bacterium]
VSGAGLRLSLLAVGFVVWIAWTLRHAARHRTAPVVQDAADGGGAEALSARDGIVLALLVLPILVYVVGVLTLDWGFNELSALFFVAAIVAGMVSGLSASASVAAYVEGMQTMVGAAALVGVARGISVVLADGHVIDTIVQGLASPLHGRPPALAAVLMVPIQALIHLPVPSVSGQAALTLPILVPLSDLLGLSRQATVLAFQTGAGLAELLVPTNAAMMAILLTAGVPYGRWLGFALRGWVLLTVVGIVGIVLAA